MRKEQAYVLLACLIIVSLAIRFYFAFSTPYYSDDESYFHLRQIEYIKTNFIPLFYDPLSFSGRLFIFSPFFHYIFAFITYFSSSWYILKIVPNIFASTIIIIIYLLAEQITKNRAIAVFSACIATFTPIYFVETVNALSPQSLAVPVTFLFLYCFYRIQEPHYALYSCILLCFLVLLESSTLILLIGLLFYLFLEKIYEIPHKKEEKEFIFFGILLSSWFYLLLYKRPLLEHGINIFWQNIPPQLIDKYYYNLTIISSIYHIGIVPLFFGLTVIYYILFNNPFKKTITEPQQITLEERKKIFPIIAITLTTTILLWFKLIEWTTGMLYLSLFTVILSGYGYMLFHNYLQRTKMRGWSTFIFSIVFILFIVSSVIPVFVYSKERIALSITAKEVAFLRFLPEITPNDARILALVDDGNYVEYFGDRKTVTDSNFLQIRDASQRIKDINTIFTTQSKIVATRIMNKYNATYVYISPTAKKLYGLEYLPYEDNNCFKLLYVGEVRLYESTCK
ncbi:MAG: hypothetical protein WC254_01975 [Candidatus Woesearchaeota archaeon]